MSGKELKLLRICRKNFIAKFQLAMICNFSESSVGARSNRPQSNITFAHFMNLV